MSTNIQSRDIEKLNIDLARQFGWFVEIASMDAFPFQYLKLYRFKNPSSTSSPKVLITPLPFDTPDYALQDAGGLCQYYYRLGLQQGKRNEEKARRRRSR